jgi:cold shock CspA family protein
MRCTGTVTDFDSDGLFGLITADDGDFVIFNLREIPPALRDRFQIGTRARFTKQASKLTVRAIELASIDASNEPVART